jgi:hypothetical protein
LWLQLRRTVDRFTIVIRDVRLVAGRTADPLRQVDPSAELQVGKGGSGSEARRPRPSLPTWIYALLSRPVSRLPIRFGPLPLLPHSSPLRDRINGCQATAGHSIPSASLA